MSKSISTLPDNLSVRDLPLPSFSDKETVEAYLKSIPTAWEYFILLPTKIQQELINFCLGKQGLKVTYDSVFRKIFNPQSKNGVIRLESLLSAILNRQVRIIKIIPREGTQLSEHAGFVIMDILVQLDDGSYANVEMQKIGYNFPLARADCYISDIIMRQYVDAKAALGNNFTFRAMHKVYCIILMEQSPKGFCTDTGSYVHRRRATFDTGIYTQDAGLHEEIFICLDNFRSIVHNITKNSNILEAWLTFLSATKPEDIHSLISAFPDFADIYQEIADFSKKPEELMFWFSQELLKMDKNLERLMAEEAQEEARLAKEELKLFKEQAQEEIWLLRKELSAARKELATAKEQTANRVVVLKQESEN